MELKPVDVGQALFFPDIPVEQRKWRVYEEDEIQFYIPKEGVNLDKQQDEIMEAIHKYRPEGGGIIYPYCGIDIDKTGLMDVHGKLYRVLNTEDLGNITAITAVIPMEEHVRSMIEYLSNS